MHVVVERYLWNRLLGISNVKTVLNIRSDLEHE